MPYPSAPIDKRMTNYPGVVAVETAADHRIILTFDNGEKRVFDVTALLTVGRFRELASPEVFKTARVTFDTVEWGNGLDLDPEYLYEHSELLEQEQE